MDVKEIIRAKRLQLIYIVVGGIGGFLYWKYVGCLSGTCPIQSVWYWTVLWGSAMGYLIGDFIGDILEKRKKKAGTK